MHDGDIKRKKDETGMIIADSASVPVENKHAAA
jgi:hypothetical protein